ncbi:hypothetical protein [Limnobacter sp.]|uniref:hypothetical protein n=1 Tax=Limnobacter sp. TaxID=2003368 RepID=UPI00258309B5|nr:hypothetical protein [Limnobacter sp.]
MRRFQSSGVLSSFLVVMAAAMPVYAAETAQQIVISKAQLDAAAIQRGSAGIP